MLKSLLVVQVGNLGKEMAIVCLGTGCLKYGTAERLKAGAALSVGPAETRRAHGLRETEPHLFPSEPVTTWPHRYTTTESLSHGVNTAGLGHRPARAFPAGLPNTPPQLGPMSKSSVPHSVSLFPNSLEVPPQK